MVSLRRSVSNIKRVLLLAVAGVRPSATLSVKLANDNISTVAIQIEAYYLSGTTKVKYVEEFFTLAADAVALRNYYFRNCWKNKQRKLSLHPAHFLHQSFHPVNLLFPKQ